MPAPERFAEHLRDFQYHPRSNRHGNALCEFVLEDLLDSCPLIAQHASEGKLVYDLNRKIRVGGSPWNIDLVVGPPPPGPPLPTTGRIPRAPPATIRIAVEAKTIMTEHGKARHNRQRDLDSFHHHIHRYDPNAIAAALTVVNLAERFRSPLRSSLSIHRNIRELVEGAVELLRVLPSRASAGQETGLEANGVIVVEHDNVSPDRTRLVTTPPAPEVGDPLHFAAFLRRICDRYSQRWR